MWCRLFSAVLVCFVCAGCGRSSGSGGGASDVPQQHAPAGDPASLPKISADGGQIAALLRERFGEATARNIRVEVEDQGGGKRVSLSGEVPNEEIRQAIMKELEVRVQNMKTEDFRLGLAGPVRQVFGFDARVGQSAVLAFASDLSLAVTAEGDVYEMASGRRINRIAFAEPPTAFPDRQLFSMAFSRDGKTLATGFQQGGIVLWQMPLGRNPKILSPFAKNDTGQRVAALEFMPDGKGLVSINTHRGEVTLWDVASGMGRTIGAHTPQEAAHQMGPTYVLAVSPDGKLIASANAEEYAVSVWDVASRSRKLLLNAESVHPEALAWSHDGKLLAVGRPTGDRRGVALYELATAKAKVFVVEPDEMVNALAFSPDDRVLAVYHQDSGLALWDVAAGKVWQTLDAEKVSMGHAVAFSPDGGVLATACEGLQPPVIRLWDVSKHPGATGTTAHMPPSVGITKTEDDRLAREIESAIRGTFDRRNIESLSAEIESDGSIQLTGRVSDAETKRVAGRDAEVYHVSTQDIGEQRLNKVVNKLEVTGHLGK